jgi:hypothetical protein
VRVDEEVRMKNITIVQALFATSALAFAAQASAQVTFYEQEGFQGRSFSTQQRVGNLERSGSTTGPLLGDRGRAALGGLREQPSRRPLHRAAAGPVSLAHRHGPERPDLLRAAAAGERACRRGQLRAMPMVTQDFRRRHNERLYDADVTSARAVVGTPGQRCWVEREHVVQQPQQQGNLNLWRARVVGAVIGGSPGAPGRRRHGQADRYPWAAPSAVRPSVRNTDAITAPTTVAQDVRRCDSQPGPGHAQLLGRDLRLPRPAARMQMAVAPGAHRHGQPRRRARASDVPRGARNDIPLPFSHWNSP